MCRDDNNKKYVARDDELTKSNDDGLTLWISEEEDPESGSEIAIKDRDNRANSKQDSDKASIRDKGRYSICKFAHKKRK